MTEEERKQAQEELVALLVKDELQRDEWRQSSLKNYQNDKERVRKRTAEYQRTHKDVGRRADAKYHASLKLLTPEQYKEQFYKQKGVCAICGMPPTKEALVIDHNHDTEKVRGLLCRRCNLRLAVVENYHWLEKAIDYLQLEES